MTPYQLIAGNTSTAEISYLSPRGHYYVAKGELDTRYARQAQPINQSLPVSKTSAPSQFELAKRAARA